MTKVTDPEANIEQFKIEQATINSEATKQRALLQATIEKNKVEADRQFGEIMNTLKALQLPTTLLEDTKRMIDMEKMVKTVSIGRTVCELEALLLYDVRSAGYAYPYYVARKISRDDLRTLGAVAFGVRARSGPHVWQPSRAFDRFMYSPSDYRINALSFKLHGLTVSEHEII
nr:ankyrin repeat-containing protein [Tanacetum cinerariifolium]